MTAPDLRPCPFCGGEAIAHPCALEGDDHDVGCFNGECPVEPHTWAETKDEAIAAWNTRVKPIPTKAEMAFDQQVSDYVRSLSNDRT